jgi:hypothetical protein
MHHARERYWRVILKRVFKRMAKGMCTGFGILSSWEQGNVPWIYMSDPLLLEQP